MKKLVILLVALGFLFTFPSNLMSYGMSSPGTSSAPGSPSSSKSSVPTTKKVERHFNVDINALRNKLQQRNKPTQVQSPTRAPTTPVNTWEQDVHYPVQR